MTKFKKQIVAAFSTGAMLLSMTPVAAYASTDLTITGNGAYANSDIDVDTHTDTNVSQSNNATVTNNIRSSNNTGENDAKYNTGGEVVIKTGDARSIVEVENMLNHNSARVACCNVGDLDVEISGNGSESDNDVDVDHKTDTEVEQDNYARVRNYVDAKTTTGSNDAYGNTGDDSTIITGDAKTDVSVKTVANSNVALVGNHGEDAASASLMILNNGSYSRNDIDVDRHNDTEIDQDNDAYVHNDIDAKAKTGYNDVKYNTDGETAILTGDAETTVEVDNMVNFNWADVDCGCTLEDLTAKVAGNGYDTRNDIDSDVHNDLDVDQGGRGNGNDAYLNNSVWADAYTGRNDIESSTGASDGDPLVWTGDSDSFVQVGNSGNVNSYGSEAPSDWADWDFDFSWSFDLGNMMSWFAAHHN